MLDYLLMVLLDQILVGGPSEFFFISASITKAVVYAILSVGWCV